MFEICVIFDVPTGDSAGTEPSEIISKVQGWAADGKPHLILDHEVYQSSVCYHLQVNQLI